MRAATAKGTEEDDQSEKGIVEGNEDQGGLSFFPGCPGSLNERPEPGQGVCEPETSTFENCTKNSIRGEIKNSKKKCTTTRTTPLQVNVLLQKLKIKIKVFFF